MTDLFLSIYEDMQGVTAISSAPFPVENLFASGSVCDQLYTTIYENKAKICDRLNEDEDQDLEEICDCFWDIMENVSRKMFEYGMLIASESK